MLHCIYSLGGLGVSAFAWYMFSRIINTRKRPCFGLICSSLFTSQKLACTNLISCMFRKFNQEDSIHDQEKHIPGEYYLVLFSYTDVTTIHPVYYFLLACLQERI